ncbi:hypothetical protein GCM10010236_75740 [Streptomyces eurythermus]|nr:hypothetical protein GCM10010236_75740 [Streptomyces eurythermus]
MRLPWGPAAAEGTDDISWTVSVGPGERSRMFYAVREYNGRKDRPKGSDGVTSVACSSGPVSSLAARSCWCGTTSASARPPRCGSSSQPDLVDGWLTGTGLIMDG